MISRTRSVLLRFDPACGASGDAKNNISRLARVEGDGNRYILARIPLIEDLSSGQFNLHKTCTDPLEQARSRSQQTCSICLYD